LGTAVNTPRVSLVIRLGGPILDVEHAHVLGEFILEGLWSFKIIAICLNNAWTSEEPLV